MPRQNLVVLLAVAVASVVCYRQADSAHRSERGRMFDTFSEVLKEVDDNYLLEVDDRELFEGALQGMMKRLDPYSEFIPPQQYSELRERLEQRIGGIGIELTVDPKSGQLVVVTPLADSPAYLAGVRAGDVLLKIDDETTAGFDPQDAIKHAVELIRGRSGTVRLTMLHAGETKPVEIAVTRAVIPLRSVLGDTRDADNQWDFLLPGHDRIGYIRITTFGDNTADETAAALEQLAAQRVRGLILDLRNNGGGTLDEAIDVCDLFVSSGTIVTTRGRNAAAAETFLATGKAPYATLPLVVLVNQHTASAAEIVAACLQDHHRATIVGQRTWGKGTVQNIIQLEGGASAIKLTTASYRRPSGEDIHRYPKAKDQEHWGVQPDDGFEVKLTDEAAEELALRRRERDVVRPKSKGGSPAAKPALAPADPQLEKGIEALEALIPT